MATHSIRRIQYGLVAVVGVVVLATAGYTVLGHSVLESLYMVVVTVFSVGYSEIIPADTALLRIFNIAIIIGGTIAVVYTVSATVQFMTQGEIERVLGARRKMRDIHRLDAHTIVCGYGRMGQILVRDLAQGGRPLVILEKSPELIAEAEKQGHLAIEGDATNEELLLRTGVKAAAHVACVLPNDADNVFIALSARNLNPGIVICARGEAPSTGHKLVQAGADHVILPPAIGGSRIAQIILQRVTDDSCAERLKAVTAEHQALGLEVSEFTSTSDAGAAPRELGAVRADSGAPWVALGLRRASGDVLVHPSPEVLVSPGDTVVAAGRPKDLAAMKKLRRV